MWFLFLVSISRGKKKQKILKKTTGCRYTLNLFFQSKVGLELDPLMILSRNIKSSFSIAFSGMVIPFAATLGVATYMFNLYESETGASFPAFLIFVASVMSISTFPEIARILTEKKLLGTPLGKVMMSSAALGDVLAWILLLFVISYCNNTAAGVTAVYIVLVMVAYSLFLWFFVRPILVRWADASTSSELFVFMLLGE